MTNKKLNIPDKLYSDKFDVSTTSNLSFFLYDEKALLFAKDPNGKVAAFHQIRFDNEKNFISKLEKDILFRASVPVHVFVHQKYLSLVPGMLFESAYASSYLSLAGENVAGKKIIHTGLENNNIHLLGAVDKIFFEFFEASKTNVVYYHGASSFLNYILSDKQNLVNQELFVKIFDSKCYIAAFNHQELILFNSFEIENKENLLQYLFGINNQLKFDRNHCKVSVFGEWDNLGINPNWGNEYFGNFKIPVPHTNLQYQNGLEVLEELPIFESSWQYLP